MENILDKLKAGQRARLIPLSESAEMRATSLLLANISVIPNFAKIILEKAGAKVGKRTKISCYSEVVFKGYEDDRPDGLVVVKNGNNTWLALIESKIGNAKHDIDQLNKYVKICKDIGARTLITISDQYAINPAHHPTFTPGGRTKKYLDVIHFSWLSIISYAQTSIHEKSVTDVEQAYLLQELIRYLQDPKCKVKTELRMHSDWPVVCAEIQNNNKLKKSSQHVENTTRSWHQLLRYLAIQLTMKTGYLFDISLSRARQQNPDLNFFEDRDALVENNILQAELEIPGAVATISMRANFIKRTIELSSMIYAPTNKSRAKGSINWFVKKFKQTHDMNPIIRVYWPRSRTPSSATLSEIETGGVDQLINDSQKKLTPVRFEVAWVIDLHRNFTGVQNFPNHAQEALLHFFRNALDVIKIPKIKPTEKLPEQKETGPKIHPVALDPPERSPNSFLQSWVVLAPDHERRF
jgi:hypothetical protein